MNIPILLMIFLSVVAVTKMTEMLGGRLIAQWIVAVVSWVTWAVVSPWLTGMSLIDMVGL